MFFAGQGKDQVGSPVVNLPGSLAGLDQVKATKIIVYKYKPKECPENRVIVNPTPR